MLSVTAQYPVASFFTYCFAYASIACGIIYAKLLWDQRIHEEAKNIILYPLASAYSQKSGVALPSPPNQDNLINFCKAQAMANIHNTEEIQ
jgi:hypothetical protein